MGAPYLTGFLVRCGFAGWSFYQRNILRTHVPESGHGAPRVVAARSYAMRLRMNGAPGLNGLVLFNRLVRRTSLPQIQGYLHPSEQRAFAGHPASPLRITMKL